MSQVLFKTHALEHLLTTPALKCSCQKWWPTQSAGQAIKRSHGLGVIYLYESIPFLYFRRHGGTHHGCRQLFNNLSLFSFFPIHMIDKENQVTSLVSRVTHKRAPKIGRRCCATVLQKSLNFTLWKKAIDFLSGFTIFYQPVNSVWIFISHANDKQPQKKWRRSASFSDSYVWKNFLPHWVAAVDLGDPIYFYDYGDLPLMFQAKNANKNTPTRLNTWQDSSRVQMQVFPQSASQTLWWKCTTWAVSTPVTSNKLKIIHSGGDPPALPLLGKKTRPGWLSSCLRMQFRILRLLWFIFLGQRPCQLIIC